MRKSLPACPTCFGPKANRYAVRCMPCNKKHKKENARGKTPPGFCLDCGEQLSVKKNATGRCQKHYRTYSKKTTSRRGSPWNKGKGIWQDKESYRIHVNAKRKSNRHLESDATRIGDRIRTLVRNSLKRGGSGKAMKTEALIGCTVKEFMSHLASQFQDGMSWETYGNGHGKWNIDHILPISRFNLVDRTEQLKVFHFSNCRPMWSIENIKKGNKMPHELDPS